MARRRLSKRRLALFAGVLLCAAFGARRLAIRFSSPTSSASGDPAPSSGSAGAAHGLGAHARFGPLQHGSRGRDGPRADATRSDATEAGDDRAEGVFGSVSSSSDAPRAPTRPGSVTALPEVDGSTHAADTAAAAAIANAGTRVAGTADALSTDRPVFATFVSNGFHEFALNWYGHVAGKLRVDNVIVAALDDETEKLCLSRGIPFHSDADLRYTFAVMATGGQPLHDPNAKVTMRGKAFQQIGALKAAFLLYLLRKGHEVLVSDVDTVWLRDPRPFFKTERVATDSDLAVSTDCLSHKLERQNDGCWHMQFNTGVLWLRPTATTTRFVGEWRDALLETEHEFEHDQDIFNRLLRVERDGTKPGFRPFSFRTNATTSQTPDTSYNSLRVAARGVAVGALPLSLFCGGHVYFVQRLHETTRARPLVVHTTYQFSQARGKRQRLREHGLWVLDDAAYYGGTPGESDSESESGLAFVAMDERDGPPAALVASASVSNHLLAAAWYRLAIRNLFAVARATGRVAILPRVTCACDRYWGNVLPGCYIQGSDARPPFPRCPLDHVMNLPNMEAAGVTHREYSFLNNSRVSDTMRDPSNHAFVELNLDADARNGSVPRVAGVTPRGAHHAMRRISLDAYPTDVEWVAAAGDAKEPVLVVSSAIASFCTFKKRTDAISFDARMAKALRAESHFCGPGDDGPGSRSCEIGFEIPAGVADDADCDALRRAWDEPSGSFRGRYARMSAHKDS